MDEKQTYAALQQRVAELEDQTKELAETNQSLTRQIANLLKTEETIRENERTYRTIAEHAQDCIMRIDSGMLPVYANEQTEKMLGVPPHEIIGKHPRELNFPTGLVKHWETTIHTVFDTKEPGRIEYKMPNGSWIDCLCIPEKDSDGQVATVLTSARDITERMTVKEALAASEERYRNILEEIEEGYFELNLAGDFTFVNNAVCKISGKSKDELLGMNNREYTTPETAKKMFEVFSQVYRTGNPINVIDYEIFDKDNRPRLMELSASLLKGKNGSPIGFRGVVRDNTEKRRIEKERGNLEKQLQQALRLEAIGTLAGGIAHDFNNLLTSILGNVSIMKVKTGPSHPNYKKLKLLEELVQSGADLTRQLLGFAMGGKYELKTIIFNTILSNNIEVIRRTRKNIIVQEDYQTNLWPVEVDRGQMEQMLLNLYVNATHAMPDGGVLTLETQNIVLPPAEADKLKLPTGRYIRVRVKDTGIGMDRKTQDRVFEPFFTTKEMGRGTGLGLASVYGIIKNHHGKITVSSAIGEGTVFSIFLPISEKEATQEVRPEDSLRKGQGTILLIDDEQAIREVSKEILNEIGYDVIVAENGKEGLQLYQANSDKVDLIILDIIMPEVSGIETFKSLRRLNKDVKVLLASGYSITEQTREMLKDGNCQFIAKPFNMRILSRRIHEILSGVPAVIVNA